MEARRLLLISATIGAGCCVRPNENPRNIAERNHRLLAFKRFMDLGSSTSGVPELPYQDNCTCRRNEGSASRQKRSIPRQTHSQTYERP